MRLKVKEGRGIRGGGKGRTKQEERKWKTREKKTRRSKKKKGGRRIKAKEKGVRKGEIGEGKCEGGRRGERSKVTFPGDLDVVN